MTALLSISDVHKSYGALKVLKGVSFEVQKDEIFAIIGPNGAGKTTLFKVMTGEVRPENGLIHFRGENITSKPAFQRVHDGFGRTFQVARVFLELTARENVVVAIESRLRAKGESLGRWYAWQPSTVVEREAKELLADVGLDRSASTEARLLSHGDKKRLEFAITLGGKPTVLMLDEPTAGMSPSDRIATVELINKVKQQRGITVIMTEHDMNVIFGLSDRLMVLNYGEIIAAGAPDEVRANKTVRDVYLGQEMYRA